MIMNTMLMVMMIFVRMRMNKDKSYGDMDDFDIDGGVDVDVDTIQDEDTRGSFASHGTSTPERGIKSRFVVCLFIFCNTCLWLSLHQPILNC